MKLDPREAYSAVPLEFSPRPWWARLLRGQGMAHCTHSHRRGTIHVGIMPDRVWLRDAEKPLVVREPARPPIRVCVECLLVLLENEIKSFRGRVIAFEPEGEKFTSYVFVEQQHLGDVGLGAEDLIHCHALVGEPLGGCQTCAAEARFLWVKRGSTIESDKLISYRGGRGYYCLAHGAEVLLACLRERLRVPLTTFNFPYGERGVYIPTYC